MGAEKPLHRNANVINPSLRIRENELNYKKELERKRIERKEENTFLSFLYREFSI